MSIIQYALKNKMGFITEEELPEVIKENRLQEILVRCGNGRFIAPAQDIKHFIDIIERDKQDYIRDVCIIRSEK